MLVARLGKSTARCRTRSYPGAPEISRATSTVPSKRTGAWCKAGLCNPHDPKPHLPDFWFFPAPQAYTMSAS